MPVPLARDPLCGRRILLISPQPWDHIPVSKHHYAEELAKQNDVVFLEPPADDGPRVLRLREHPTLDRLRIASWRPGFPRRLRFHAYPLYSWLIAREARKIARQIGGPDLVWCFDFNLFPDLAAFGARESIFHPVDPLTSQRQVDIGASADLIISVSDRILASFTEARFGDRRLLVNHGLAEAFATLARSPAKPGAPNGPHCGFFGNLDRAVIDIDRIEAIVRDHPDVTFHFWGPFSNEGAFGTRIADRPNVRAPGPLLKDELARQAADMDLFLLAYIDHPTESDRSNSHKLLEYMSTGKATVSTRMDCYQDDTDLVLMSQEPGDRDFGDLFARAILNIEEVNAPERMAKRKSFAGRYTYSANVAQIADALGAAAKRPNNQG